MALEIRPLEFQDIGSLHEFLRRHSAGNGRDGELIHSPFEGPRQVPLEMTEKRFRDSWVRPLTEAGWERCWGVLDEGAVLGQLLLRQSPPIATAVHRATLEMGIERAHRGRRLGSQLMEIVLEWARSQPSLEWIDLGVFEHNEAARALYARFGFQMVGRREDQFRVHGRKITDIQMSLRLR